MEKTKLNRRVFAQVAGAGAATIALAKSQAAEQEKSKPVWSAGAAETMADIPAGVLPHRWISWSPHRPSHPNVEAWHARLLVRKPFQDCVVGVTRPAP